MLPRAGVLCLGVVICAICASTACGSRTGFLTDDLAGGSIVGIGATAGDGGGSSPKVDPSRPLSDASDDTSTAACGGCADDLACTIDSCRGTTCVHIPDDTRCGLGEGCDPVEGCVRRLLALHDAPDKTEILLEIRMPSLEIRELTTFPRLHLTDIALLEDGRLYGMSGTEVRLVDPHTGATTKLAQFTLEINGLEVASANKIFGTGYYATHSLDRSTNDEVEIGTYPAGVTSGGDLALFGEHLFATGRRATGNDLLIEFYPDKGTPRVIATLGLPCVTGLATMQGVLYGFTCEGHIATIDPNSGQTQILKTTPYVFAGAAGR